MNGVQGMQARFVPLCLAMKPTGRPVEELPQPAVGIIDFVHWRHGWFRVRWYAGDTIQHERFKFCDIGKVVELVGRCKVDKNHN